MPAIEVATGGCSYRVDADSKESTVAENPFHGKELLLIGTVHRDPDGVAKLRRFLRRERPGAVAVEVSPYALSYRRTNCRRLKRQLVRRVKRLAQRLGVTWQHWGQIQAIRAQLQLPFEYRAAVRYCRDTGAGLHCLDSSAWSRHAIHSHWPQLLSPENIETLFGVPCEGLEDMVGRDYQLAERLLSDTGHSLVSAFTRAWEEDPQWRQREAELARQLADLLDRMEQGRLAYVGGWQHLLSPTTGISLYERLAHLEPRRVLLGNGFSPCL